MRAEKGDGKANGWEQEGLYNAFSVCVCVWEEWKTIEMYVLSGSAQLAVFSREVEEEVFAHKELFFPL